MGIWPLLNVPKWVFLLTFFGHVLTILAWTKYVRYITHFPSCFFLTFPLKYYLYKKIKLSNKDYLLLISTFIGMIISRRSIQLSFQSHQMCTFSAGLGMARNRDGQSCSSVRKFYATEKISIGQISFRELVNG